MQPSARQISTCPTCGGVLEETPGGGLGCMSCLLHAGIGSEEEVAQDSTSNALGGSTRFGVYEIDCQADGSLCELGRGAMGVTYRATDTSLRRKVALKIIKIDIAARSADARERFMREARAAAALRHEHIATIYQFGMRLETGQYFYAMELIEGENLEERVHRAGPLNARTTIGIAEQVTSALAAAEKHGLVHRDLKPANLMLVNADDPEVMGSDQPRSKRSRIRALRKSGIPVVKIIDFGLAKAFHTATDPNSLTHGRFVGTPAFASPEQFAPKAFGAALDVRSDIYSLGETLWFALTGKTPFAGRGVEEIHRAQQSNALPIEQLKGAHVPHRLKSLLESMLAFEPASRPGTHELAARLQRSSPEGRSVRRTRAALAVATAIVFGISTLFLAYRSRVENAASNPAPEKSIAVLPFENRSEDKANAYFADGIQDEILTRLSKIADLKVISRTSTQQYKSGIPRSVREIGMQLGVAHVVEGSVQRSGNRVRVNVQLVDARSHRDLWGQTYDRDLADTFAIQSEIATSIAGQLQTRLSASEKNAIEQAPTNDITAFDLYSHAENLLLTTFSSVARAKLLEVVDLLNQAVARDPSFFQAYCRLVNAHDRLYSLGLDHTAARLALAEEAVQAASRLRPNAGETHLARAEVLYQGHFDYDGALAELELARQTLPNHPRLPALKGYIERRQGHWQESTRSLERSLELDPRNFFTLQQIALSYGMLHRYADETSVLERALAVEPDDVNTKVEFAAVQFHWKADTEPWHQTIDSIRATNPGALPNVASDWFSCALAEHDLAAAENALDAFGDTGLTDYVVHLNRALLEGVLARMVNDADKARSAFTAARAEQEKIVQAQPDYGPALCVLGLIDAALGRKDAALREGWRAVELVPVEKDAIGGPLMIQYLAMIAAWAGDKDLACQQLAIAVRPPSTVSYGQLKSLPWWDPLRGDPRFEKIVESLAPKERH